ncbi:MAG: 16S rRNA (cytidine1402-2'-O)-methyltransferase, partial [Ulvibacter sp.]
EKGERKSTIKRLEKLSIEFDQSQSFIETPYRNNQLLESLLKTLHGETMLCIACDITLSSEFIRTATVNEWKKIKVDLHKRPTLFILQN